MEYLFAGVVVVFALAYLWMDNRHAAERLDLIKELGEQQELERERWANERRELLNRIQHPERMPVKASTGRTAQNLSPEAVRALHQVGTAAPQQVTDGN